MQFVLSQPAAPVYSMLEFHSFLYLVTVPPPPSLGRLKSTRREVSLSPSRNTACGLSGFCCGEATVAGVKNCKTLKPKSLRAGTRTPVGHVDEEPRDDVALGIA